MKGSCVGEEGGRQTRDSPSFCAPTLDLPPYFKLDPLLVISRDPLLFISWDPLLLISRDTLLLISQDTLLLISQDTLLVNIMYYI